MNGIALTVIASQLPGLFGASSYTYACATPRLTTADWIGADVQALEFIGGVPRLIVPDQTRSLITNPDRYDPEPNRTYEEFAQHTPAASPRLSRARFCWCRGGPWLVFATGVSSAWSS